MRFDDLEGSNEKLSEEFKQKEIELQEMTEKMESASNDADSQSEKVTALTAELSSMTRQKEELAKSLSAVNSTLDWKFIFIIYENQDELGAQILEMRKQEKLKDEEIIE